MTSSPAAEPPLPRTVHPYGRWALGHDGEREFAVSRRCRHQLADLAGGHVDADGCLVCPWHGSRYDTGSGAMVSGPRGFLLWRGPTPGYSGAIRLIGRVWRLRVGRVRRSPQGVEVG